MTKLKRLLEESGMSVSEFARRTGIQQSTLHRIVNGQVNAASVTVGNFMRIAHGLGLSAEELYYDEVLGGREKRLIDTVYAMTGQDGRRAMLANALGVRDAYPLAEEFLLPDIDGNPPDFSVP